RHTRSKRDWSSDVCSSDLDVLMVMERVAGYFAEAFSHALQFREARAERDKQNCRYQPGQGTLHFVHCLAPQPTIDNLEKLKSPQIGRASCRERGWVYVVAG